MNLLNKLELILLNNYFKWLNIYAIIFLILFENHFYQSYNYCSNCINTSSENFKCLECPLGFIFKGLNIVSKEKTLNEIIYNKKSIARFGDGEYKIIFGYKANFQSYDETLAKRLFQILNSNEKNLLIGINLPYRKKDFEERSNNSQKMWNIFFQHFKIKLSKIINKNKKYYSSLITRFYSAFKDKSNSLKYIQKIKKIWDKRDILIIEGEKTRVGIGNNLFNNTKSIRRIICPVKNAFKYYNQILNSALKFEKSVLILIALGPTASILSYDLYKHNYQVVDIGHIDIEYELFLRKAKQYVKIPYKYVSEAKGGTTNIKSIKDMNYYNQIAYKILN